MAKQDRNAVMRSTRGMFAKQVVFKERAGDVYVSGPPKKRGNKKATPSQIAVQSRFRNATDYAKMVMESPELKAAYKKIANAKQSAYNIAFRDAFNVPVVTRIIRDSYRGVVGDTIIVQAKDDFKVHRVEVAIFDSADVLIEQGGCEMVDKFTWRYVVIHGNASLPGTKIKASAFDIPENEGMLEVIL